MRWWQGRKKKKEKGGVERVENKAINVIGCLDGGQSEDRRREERKNRKTGRGRRWGIVFEPFKRPLEGVTRMPDLWDVSALTHSMCVCEYPSVYLPVLICVHLSTTLYVCCFGGSA